MSVFLERFIVKWNHSDRGIWALEQEGLEERSSAYGREA